MLRNACLPLVVVVTLAVSAAAAFGAGPTIRLNGGRFEVEGLDPAGQKSAAAEGRFAVYVVGDPDTPDKDRPAVLGSLRVADGALRFVPRFPLVPGVRYRAVFRPQRAGGQEVRAEFQLPKPKAAAPAVRHVYPSRDTLPENQLKFYFHFSAPMSRGEAYRHVQLLDESAKPVELPFLELDEELWDPEGKRFTLFFDPGRIKRGLKPREEVGPALIEGKRYTLVIDRRWPDAQGNPLEETYRKAFRVAAPDDTPIDPQSWKIAPVSAGKALPLTVRFPEPLDHALVQRLVWVTDAKGARLAGTVRVSDAETRWHFTPELPWQAGRYDLVVDTELEDLAGNRVGRPFEVDLFKPIQRQLKKDTVKREFVVR